jgi:hypothetical protein
LGFPWSTKLFKQKLSIQKKKERDLEANPGLSNYGGVFLLDALLPEFYKK